MKKSIKRFAFLFCFTGFLAVQKVVAQSDSAIVANADTKAFSANTPGGWKIYNSFIKQISDDSVKLELIIRHSNNIVWSNSQFIGSIKNDSLRPAISQSLTINLLDDIFSLRINSDGKCYVRFVSGTYPGRDPVVIPIAVAYKRNE